MFEEAIILAGGKGTRLQSVVIDVPKPMADIEGLPFLHYQVLFLKNNGIKKIIMSVGYKHDIIINFFGENYLGVTIVYAIENEPLGTGGALKLALGFAKTNNVVVLNGDTIFDIDFQKLGFIYSNKEALMAFAVRQIPNNSRYDGIQIDENLRIRGFSKEINGENIYINAGIYAINKKDFLKAVKNLPLVFSLELDFFNKSLSEFNFIAVPYAHAYFLDIGIPEDYEKGITEIPNQFENKTKKNKALFLDRDGVINEHIENGYVLSWDDFKFKSGILDLLKDANSTFKYIFVVTNQRCIGKGLLTEQNLLQIHDKMILEINQNGGRIDKIYFCPALDNTDPCRKPNEGMFIQAKADFSDVDFSNSIMIGDSFTDMIPAKKLGMQTFYVNQKNISRQVVEQADYVFEQITQIKF